MLNLLAYMETTNKRVVSFIKINSLSKPSKSA